MYTFKQFLALAEAENKEDKIAVFTFGRMNPPTTGHLKLAQSVHDKAAELGGDPYVFVSTSNDKKKNPLDYTTKIKFIKQLFKNVDVVDDSSIKSPFHAVGYLADKGYTHLVMLAGSDRIEEYTKRLNAEKAGLKSIKIIEGGGERSAEVSGTNAREAAAENDLAAFRIATGWKDQAAVELMKAVRKGMELE